MKQKSKVISRPTAPPPQVLATAHLFSYFALGILVFAAFLPALSAGYLWDDESVTRNPVVMSESGLATLWLNPGEHKLEKHYWPIPYTTFWIEHRLWGLRAPASHFINLLLHAANALLVFEILRRMKFRAAWMAAAIFAIHPTRVEVAAWVIERKDLLAAFFFLLGFLFYSRFQERSSKGAYAAALICYAAGMLSKSVAVTLPAVILTLEWLRPPHEKSRRETPAQRILPLLPFFILGFAFALFDSWLVGKYDQTTGGFFSIADRLMIAARGMWFYAGKLAWPINLQPIYPHWTSDAYASALGPYIPLALAAAISIRLLRAAQRRALILAAVLYALMLAPSLGLLQHGYMMVSLTADRFQYLAAIAPMVLAGECGIKFMDRFPARAKSSLASVVLATLGFLTLSQTSLYRDPVQFWSHARKLNPHSWMIENNLGAMALKEKGEDAAIEHYKSVLNSNPNSELAHVGYGRILAKRKQWDEAVLHFNEALKINSSSHEAHLALGLAFTEKGDLAQAESHMKEAMRLGPNYADPYFGMGLIRISQGRKEEAIALYEKGLSYDDLYDDAHFYLGSLWAEKGDAAKAEKHFNRALELNPKNAAVWGRRGTLLVNSGKVEEGLAQCRRALELDPDNAEANQTVGIELGEQGEIAEAEKHLRRATQSQPNSAEAWNNLGIILARQSRFKEAGDVFEKAVNLKPQWQEAVSNLRRAREKQ